MSDIQDFIDEAFEANFERMRNDMGRSITPDVKEAARQQVRLYWEKLKELAEKVTETEVHLTLPEQRSPRGRRFTLEGVVDIVREADTTTMYDVKTHLDATAAGEDLEPFVKQLNVYAHIWQTLRGQDLDATAIITTRPTRELRQALDTKDSLRVLSAFQVWNPVIDIPFAQSTVQEVVHDFGDVVDLIEDHVFSPPPLEVLRAPARPGAKTPFATFVCRNCDARFSCDSYRQHAVASNRTKRPEEAIRYFMEEYGSDYERNEWTDANIQTDGRDRFGLSEDNQ